MKILLLIVLCFCTVCGPARAGDTTLLNSLLHHLQQLQISSHPDFKPGQYASYREYHWRKDVYKNDANSFYTGLVGFTLRYLRPHFTEEQQKIADSIISNTMDSYRWFKNRKGRETYNYWSTDPPEIFPNSGWMNLFNKSQALPDDLDVTSIVLMAMGAERSSVVSVHQIMREYVNGSVRTVKNTFKEYKQIPAYSTWFGKKMPVDFDICVLANVLLMVNQYAIPYNASDSATQQLIGKMIGNRHHITHPHYISPYYARTPVILYHLSRLMEAFALPELEQYRATLIADALQQYQEADNLVDKVILSTALYRWGQEPPEEVLALPHDLITEMHENDFVFFIADMAGMLANPFNNLLGKTRLGKFYYYSPAYNTVLLIENILYQQLYEKRYQ